MCVHMCNEYVVYKSVCTCVWHMCVVYMCVHMHVYKHEHLYPIAYCACMHVPDIIMHVPHVLLWKPQEAGILMVPFCRRNRFREKTFLSHGHHHVNVGAVISTQVCTTPKPLF